MSGLRVLLAKEALEAWRTLRLPVMLVLFLLIGFGSPLLARFTPELLEALSSQLPGQIVIPPPATADAVDQLLKNVGQIGTLAAILVAMGSVSFEKERGTAALVLSRPVGPAAFIAAKAIVLAGLLGVVTAAAAAAAWAYTAVLFEPLPPDGFAWAAALQWLALVAFGAFALLGSTLARSALPAAGFGLAAFAILSILAVFPAIGPYLPAGLGTPSRALALGAPVGDLAGPVLGNLALAVAPVLAAWAAFRGQER